jgi:hypothetical protein
LEDEELDSEEDESPGELLDSAVDVKMTSPKPRKRELRWDKEAS